MTSGRCCLAPLVVALEAICEHGVDFWRPSQCGWGAAGLRQASCPRFHLNPKPRPGRELAVMAGAQP